MANGDNTLSFILQEIRSLMSEVRDGFKELERRVDAVHRRLDKYVNKEDCRMDMDRAEDRTRRMLDETTTKLKAKFRNNQPRQSFWPNTMKDWLQIILFILGILGFLYGGLEAYANMKTVFKKLEQITESQKKVNELFDVPLKKP